MSKPHKEAVRVFIVEDHTAVRQMLGKLIQRSPQLTLCGDADSAEAALVGLEACRPQLLIVDVSLPGMDGIDLISLVGDRYPEVLILAVSGHDESVYALPALRAGARGYVMKGDVRKVAEAIQHIVEGGVYASDEVLARWREEQ